MKPYPSYSNVNLEWLDELPSGWTAARLRDISKVPITNGVGAPGEFEDPAWARYIRITDINDSRTLRDDVFKSQPPHVASGYEVLKGDILLAAVGATFGNPTCTALMGIIAMQGTWLDCVVMNRYCQNSCRTGLESSHYWAQVNSRVIQSTIQNFSASKYKIWPLANHLLAISKVLLRF